MAWNTPATATSFGKLLASFWNAQVRDNFKAIGDVWATYTPTLTNVTIGTGGGAIAQGRYINAGKLVIYSIAIVLGTSGASVSGGVSISLPVSPLGTATNFPLGICTLWDNSATATVHGVARWNPGTTAISLAYNTGTTPVSSSGVSNTLPWTWAASDAMYIQGTYEAA